MKKNNRSFLTKIILLFLFLFNNSQFVFCQPTKKYDLVKDFKAKADDKTDCYNAFKNAAATISQAGGGILNIPHGKYYISSYKIVGGPDKSFVSDIIFAKCKKLIVIGNNSIIRVNGKFSRNNDYKVPNVPYHYAYNNTVCPFKLSSCTNVLIKDITLYGEVDKMQREVGTVEGGNYGICISDEVSTDISSNIVLQNVTAHHFAADGFLIRSNGRNIVLNNCRSFKNARQGLSIVKGHNIKCYNSSFDSTGQTGTYGWHAPGAGIDVENEFGRGDLTDVQVRNCSFRGNRGFQIVTTLAADSVNIDSCFISDATAGYSNALNGVGMYSTNSTLYNSIIFGGIQIDISDQIYTGPLTQQISKNIIYSGDRAIVSADYGRPVNINDNIFVMLPKPSLNNYFIYIQNKNCRFNRNIVVEHADRLKKAPNLVTALVQNCIEAIEDFWLVNGYDIPVEKQKSFYYLTATNGTQNVKDHYFGASDVVARYDYKKTHFLPTSQVNTILNNSLFTSYNQSSFNAKFLLQANTLRKYTRTIVANSKK